MRDRKRRSRLLLAALAVVATIVIGACGTTTIRTTTETATETGTTSPGGLATPGEEPDTPAPNQPPEQAKIGSTISLSGFSGLKMDVKVTGFLDPATGGQFDEPSPGARFVGVKIAPGDSRNVCIPFELPNAQKGKKFQFTLNSGFASETGEWSLS